MNSAVWMESLITGRLIFIGVLGFLSLLVEENDPIFKLCFVINHYVNLAELLWKYIYLNTLKFAF